jgi:glycosyltransferase involved in cell wall biosynthesis
MKKSVVVITATTGDKLLEKCVDSVSRQTYSDLIHLVVADGPQFISKTQAIIKGMPKVTFLPLTENTGANRYFGHRIYAGTGHLVNQDYIIYLDQDNWFDDDHVELMMNTINGHNLDWCYSLRKIHDADGTFLFNDDCESLGKWPTWYDSNMHHVDTNCYCVKREIAIRLGSLWHQGRGADTVFFLNLNRHFPKYDTTGKYSVNYRLGSTEVSVKREFFEKGNQSMSVKYSDTFPWRQ